MRLTLLVLLSVSLLPLAAAQMPLVIANYVGQSSQQVTQTTVNATSLLLSCDGTTAIFYGNDRAGKPPQAVNEGVWVVPTNLFRAQAMSVPGSKLADMIGATTDSQYVLFRVNETALFATQLSSPSTCSRAMRSSCCGSQCEVCSRHAGAVIACRCCGPHQRRADAVGGGALWLLVQHVHQSRRAQSCVWR